MKDFDQSRRERHEQRAVEMGDRTFRFCGRTLEFVANAPYTVTQKVAALTEETDGSRVFDTLEAAVLGLLEPGSATDFREAVSDPSDPVTFDDLIELANWLIEAQVRRPPTPPSSSPDTSSTTGTLSTVPSSPAPAAA